MHPMTTIPNTVIYAIKQHIRRKFNQTPRIYKVCHLQKQQINHKQIYLNVCTKP